MAVDQSWVDDMKKYCKERIQDSEEIQDSKYKELQQTIKKQQPMRSSGKESGTEEPRNKVKFAIPKYKGLSNERPMKFLSELDKYINLVNPDFDQFICVVSQALEETAQDWWYLIQEDVSDYDDFKKQFKNRYWNAATQREAKRKVEFGRYNANGKFTRTNYATYIFGLAKELELPLTEDELVRKLCDHFDKNIRHAMIVQQTKDKNTLFEILSDYDHDDARQNKNRPNQTNTQNAQQMRTNNNNNGNGKNPNQSKSPNSANNQKPKQWQSRNVNKVNITEENKQTNQTKDKSKAASTKKSSAQVDYDKIEVCNDTSLYPNVIIQQEGNAN